MNTKGPLLSFPRFINMSERSTISIHSRNYFSIGAGTAASDAAPEWTLAWRHPFSLPELRGR